MKTCIVLLAILAMGVTLSCGGGSDETSEISGEDSGSGLPHMDLTVRNTIGVELGDSNYVFGQIQDAVPTENGGVAVLDATTFSIRLFSNTGDFISTMGRQGSGPGEFQMPRGLAILENGSIIVSDLAGGALEIFDDSLNWKDEISGFFPRPPDKVISAGDSSFTGLLRAFDREEGTMGFSIVRIESSPEPAVIYHDEMYSFNSSMVGPLGDERRPHFSSDDSGRVFISQPASDLIDVTGYTVNGDIFLKISQDIDPMEKTVEQLAYEEAEFEEFSTRMGSRGGRMSGVELRFDPEPYRNAVTGLGIDSESRLWVRLGAYEYPFWNVYDMEGNLLMTASLQLDDPDMDYFIVRIEDEGVVAWVEDPTTWPRIFMVELP